jgi:hypothetical protein
MPLIGKPVCAVPGPGGGLMNAVRRDRLGIDCIDIDRASDARTPNILQDHDQLFGVAKSSPRGAFY